jgi:hypothetical protein
MFDALRPGAQVEHLWLAALVMALIGTAGLLALAL